MLLRAFRLNKLFKQKQNEVFSVFVRNKQVWDNNNVVKSPFKDIQVPETTVCEYVWRNLDRWPTKTAAVCGVTNRSYTYEKVYKQSQILGANLRKKFGVVDGDIVAIMMHNEPEYPTIVMGILAAGGIVTTLNPAYTAHEVQKQLALSDPKLIFVNPETVTTVKAALQMLKENIPVITLDIVSDLPQGTISYKENVEDRNVDLSILKNVGSKVNDVAFLPFSSGTTGLPKGVELTHRNVLANCEQQSGRECRFHHDTTITHQETALIILPLYHAYALLILMLHKISHGMKMVTLPKFKPDTFVNALVDYRINLLYVAPPLILFLGSSPLVKKSHTEHLKCVLSGAAPLPTADIERFLSKVQPHTHFGQVYGMTEAGPLTTATPFGVKNYASVGFPLPNFELRVTDTNLKNLGPNEVGELLIKAPNVMKGYRNNPTANKEVFVGDGWYRSGDMAWIDESGAVYITDRLKELIKVKGFQVPPAELESLLKEHPAVFDAAVVGIPDPDTGERPKAFVVRNEALDAKKEEILAFVNEKVAPFKRIKELLFVDDIPKNPSGKILRRVLRDKYC